jgi:hypothetical protein
MCPAAEINVESRLVAETRASADAVSDAHDEAAMVQMRWQQRNGFGQMLG